MTHASTTSDSESSVSVIDTVIWDRKTEGGFPETKELKNRVRNIIEPDRDLGHIDRSLKKNKQVPSQTEGNEADEPDVAKLHGDGTAGEQKKCQDCT